MLRPSAEPAHLSERRTTVQMQRRYAVPIEDVQQLALGTMALITGGLHAWVQVYPVVLPEDLVRMATAFVSAPPEELPSPVVPPPPAARQKTPRRTPPAAGGKEQSQEAKPPEPVPAPQPRHRRHVGHNLQLRRMTARSIFRGVRGRE